MTQSGKTLAIIGGGAAGLATAIAAGRVAQESATATRVVVYEAEDRTGRSILATGNGRCNFSNARVEREIAAGVAAYRNQDFVMRVFDALHQARLDQGGTIFGAEPAENAVLDFFAGLGLMWREEGEGRLYPLANKATSVLDVLRAGARAAGVEEVCDHKVVQLDVPTRAGDRFHLRMASGEVAHADVVILAVGGKAACSLLPEGVARVALKPVLGPLRTEVKAIRQLNNIRVRGAVELVDFDGVCKAREEGEILFRDYGVSGIAIFNLSRFALPGDCVRIDFLPALDRWACESMLHERRRRVAGKTGVASGEEVLRGMLLPAVAEAVLRAAGFKPDASLEKRDVSVLAHTLKAFALEVVGIGEARQCQVHRGGACVDGFDPRTLESHAFPGLYVVGEALEVDAPCGGYNLHWAWASGLLAGCAATANKEKAHESFDSRELSDKELRGEALFERWEQRGLL